ncbi:MULTISPECIES: HAD family hydrolase [Nocardioides]|uniref:HAD family hydrolase n=1 Tax=Nocardioides vastitatis TaxID=2568655 RepID=A0ABW0ZKZ9_9ACTN|nr:HAD family hydrolase [Nocardioides sp.]THI96798.1 haloacid dehalogenase-like hydrolase [Nocardioides sp.]
MPPAIYTQNVIALIWDFDKTLTHGYMQEPLFEAYDVDARTFWDESNELAEYYSRVGCKVSKDTVYLNHMLSYVQHGVFKDLTNDKLREIGAAIELAPGIPEFFDRMRQLVLANERYRRHEVRVEHYVVSTGLRAMIEGSKLFKHVDGVWACDLLPAAAPPGYREQLEATSEVVAQVGYTIDNTSKTRAIFEINKGVNVQEGGRVDVNSVIPEDSRRVPIRNMIYIADGPSDVPSFSVINKMGGKTFGVYAPGESNYNNAAELEEQGRVNSIALADYGEGTAADMWLSRSIRQIADGIVSNRERALASYGAAPGHVVT